MKKQTAILVLLLAACGDNFTPPAPDASLDAPEARTYEDAVGEFSVGWCAFLERCYPDDYEEQFLDATLCRAVFTSQMCAESRKCAEPFPFANESKLERCIVVLEYAWCDPFPELSICFEAVGL